jgi:hypothetical protein
VGVCAIFEHFSGFEFFLLPSRIHARPPADNANRWAADDNHENSEIGQNISIAQKSFQEVAGWNEQNG